MGDINQLPGLPSGQEDGYPWVLAMQAARRRLPRVKIAIAASGTFGLGALTAIVAGSTGSAVAAPAPATSAPAPAATDIFGQTQGGPDNPAAGGPADSGPGAAPPPVPGIVSAQS